MELEKLDWVSAPAIDNKDWQKTAESLQKHAFESAQRIMVLTNELIELKETVRSLKRSY